MTKKNQEEKETVQNQEAAADTAAKEEKEAKIDTKIQTILSLHKKDKMSEKNKQAQIYSAMNNIKIIRK